jgi:hypothetical protein
MAWPVILDFTEQGDPTQNLSSTWAQPSSLVIVYFEINIFIIHVNIIPW